MPNRDADEGAADNRHNHAANKQKPDELDH
jgi:hypothetical protein